MTDQPKRTRPSPTPDTSAPADASDAARLHARVAELERERDHLATLVGILQEISASLHFVDILQTIAQRLGRTLDLDRCAIFLTREHAEVRLVASFEDPSIRNLVVDVRRYPELRRAFESRQTVFIPDVAAEPMLAPVRAELNRRRVAAILVVPLEWQGTTIGAIFVRTKRDAGRPFTDADVQFCQLVARITATALRNAHRFDTLLREQRTVSESQQRAERQRLALVEFVRLLLDRYARASEPAGLETLSKTTEEELDRLVGVALRVLAEEATG